MAVATARAIAPELEAVVCDPDLYDSALDAVVESFMVCAEIIDTHKCSEPLALHRAIYVKVPPRMRGATFGQKLLTQLSRQGFRGRVGVADDRFTAYVAAVRVEHRGRTSRLDDPAKQSPLFHQSCTAVPRGGSAAFLAPLPLSYLPIDPDVQHLLETCGVKTLGDFATLPPPSVSRDWIDEDSDFQALARGEGPATLKPRNLDELLAEPLTEKVELNHEIGELQAVSYALRALCEHVSQRLVGRDRAAATLALRLVGPAGQVTMIDAELSRPSTSGRQILECISTELGDLELHHPVAAVELTVAEVAEPECVELDLFGDGLAVSGQPAAGVAARQAEAFRNAKEGQSGRGQSGSRVVHWKRRRRPSRRPPKAQQSFFE